MQASAGLKTASGVSEWLRTGRIDKRHLPKLAALTGTTTEWWLTPEAPVPPTGKWLTPHAIGSAPSPLGAPAVAGATRSAGHNVEPATLRAAVPVISWVQAGELNGVVDLYHPGDAEEWIPALHSRPGPHAFALRVAGDSMTSQAGESFPDGTLLIVDPDVAPTPGRYVIAKDVQTQKATFKRLVTDGGRWYLRPLNQAFPTQEIDRPELRIIGVVIEFSIGGKL